MLALLSAGCSGSPPLDARVEPSSWVENAFSARWDGPAGTAWVEFVDERRVVGRRPTDGPTRIPLVGLPPGRTVRWRAVVEDERGRRSESPIRSLRTAPPPPFAPQVDAPAPGAAMADGFALFSLYDRAEVNLALIVDGDGTPVWWVATDPEERVLRVRPTADGRGVWVATNDADVEDETIGRIDRFSLDGEELVSTVAPGLHHDFLEDDDGTLVYLSHQRGLADRPDWVGDELRRVAIGESDPAATEVLFSYEDDYPVPAWAPCAHSRHDFYVPGFHEWTHSNSLVPAEDGDGWWIMARFPDMLVRVSADGRFLGQIGGRDATWRTEPEPGHDAPAFVHAHLSRAVEGGLLVFDNGVDHGELAPSRLVELRLDPEAEVARVGRVWANPSGTHTTILGHLEPVPGGHVLATWGSDHVMTELDANAGVVWSLDVPDTVFGRVSFLPELRP